MPKTMYHTAKSLILAAKMGRLHAQLMEGNPREIVVEYGGEIPQEATGPLTVAILRGFLESHLSGPVNAIVESVRLAIEVTPPERDRKSVV